MDPNPSGRGCFPSRGFAHKGLGFTSILDYIHNGGAYTHYGGAYAHYEGAYAHYEGAYAHYEGAYAQYEGPYMILTLNARSCDRQILRQGLTPSTLKGYILEYSG